MTTYNKIRWSASILLVFFIVLITNLIDKDNFSKIKQSVTTIYEDRIVANDLIFEISLLIQDKEVAILTSDSVYFQKENSKANNKINRLINQYAETKLTVKEQSVFSNLKDELRILKSLETTSSENLSMLRSIEKITQQLHDLSKIQLYEGKEQLAISNKAMNTINLLTKGEIIFLILMAILIQVVILYKPKKAHI